MRKRRTALATAAITALLLATVGGAAAADDKKPAAAAPPAPMAPPAAHTTPAASGASMPGHAAPAATPPAPGAAGTSGAAASAPAQADAPKPSKELEAFMKPFEGAWRCDTKFPAGAFGPGAPELMAKSTVKFKKDLDGFFYRGEYAVKKQKGLPMQMHGLFFIGWDPGASQVIVTGVDNMGSLGTGTGKIEGNTVTYTGETFAMGKKMKTRESMGRKGDKEAFHTIEVDLGRGWVPFLEDTCKR